MAVDPMIRGTSCTGSVPRVCDVDTFRGWSSFEDSAIEARGKPFRPFRPIRSQQSTSIENML